MEEAQSERTSQSIARGRSGSRIQQTRRRPGRESREVRRAPAVFGADTLQDIALAHSNHDAGAPGHIALRSAIVAAEARSGPDTTPLPGDTLRLRIAGVGEDAAANGDPEIFDTFAR